MNTTTLTFGQSYLSAKIRAVDTLLSLPYSICRAGDLFNALHAATTAASVLYPDKPRTVLDSEIRACFPQFNTRFHS